MHTLKAEACLVKNMTTQAEILELLHNRGVRPMQVFNPYEVFPGDRDSPDYEYRLAVESLRRAGLVKVDYCWKPDGAGLTYYIPVDVQAEPSPPVAQTDPNALFPPGF